MGIGYVGKDYDVSIKATSGLTDITVTIIAMSTGTADDDSPLTMVEIDTTGIYTATFQPDVVDTLFLTAVTADTVLNGKTSKVEVQPVSPSDINTTVDEISQQITDGSTGFIL